MRPAAWLATTAVLLNMLTSAAVAEPDESVAEFCAAMRRVEDA